MLLNKNKALLKTQSDVRFDAVSGIYTTKEARLQQKKAFSGANFWLGDTSKSKSPFRGISAAWSL